MPSEEYTEQRLDRLRQEITEALSFGDLTHGLARTLRATLKELELHRHHLASQRRWPTGHTDLTPERVQIGGGAHRIDGFLNIDLVPPADLLWDIREGIPLADSVVDFVFSEHFLEHIDYPRSAKLYASEAYRILRPSGHAVTGVPNAAHVLNGYPNDPDVQGQMITRWYANRDCLNDINTYLDLINYVFRDQDDNPKYNPHYWAYDYDKLVSLFSDAGFSTVEPWTFDPFVANADREWGSVYVIATK